MKLAKYILASFAFAAGTSAFAQPSLKSAPAVQKESSADAPDTRPWTLRDGMEAPPATVDFQDLTGWTITFDPAVVEAQLERSTAQRLWKPYSAKVQFRPVGKSSPAQRKVTIAPPQPIPLKEAFDSLSIWLTPVTGGLDAEGRSQQLARKAQQVSVRVRLPDGSERDLPLGSQEIRTAYWDSWFPYYKKFDETFPAGSEFLSISLSHFGGGADAVVASDETIATGESARFTPGEWGVAFLAQLAFGKAPTHPVSGRIPTLEELGITPRPDLIVPPLAEERPYKNTITQQGEGWRLAYEGADETIQWIYTPETGSLSDIRLVNKSGNTIQPAADGGWQLEDADIKKTLISVTEQDGALIAKWRWETSGGVAFDAEWNLRPIRKSLVIEASADTTSISGFSVGKVKGVTDPVLTEVPYLVMRGDRGEPSVSPVILSGREGFFSAFLDWYVSEASMLKGDHGERKDGIVINGGSIYHPKTDGIRNKPFERLVLSASQRFQETLPFIPNPPNPTNEQTKDAVWMTHMGYTWKIPDPDYYPELLKKYQRWRAFGLENIHLRLHVNAFRNYVNPRTAPPVMNATIDPDIGGDEAMRAFVKGMQALGYRVGPYTNYALASPVAFEDWTSDLPALRPDGNWRFGEGPVNALKPVKALEIQEKWSTRLREKFGFDCVYPDQLTCIPLWYGTDYDARTEGAGKFTTPFRVWAQSLRDDGRIFQGPVLSEGMSQWMLAGFADSYAQPGIKLSHALNGPDVEYDTIVDFQLLRIHPLSNDTGYGLRVLFAREPQPVTPDPLLAAQIAYGNIGHLFERPNADMPENMLLKSYFMIKGLQPWYANEPVTDIAYHADGKLLTTEEAIRGRTIGNDQVFLRYANGLEVFVNRNRKGKNWNIMRGDAEYILPPHGYYCELPGKVTVWSALRDGLRRDYADTEKYLYINANGKPYDFGAIRASQAYVIHKEADALRLIPAPFVRPENVSILPSGIVAAWGEKHKFQVQELSEKGEVIGSQNFTLDDEGRLLLPVNGKAFSLRIQPDLSTPKTNETTNQIQK